MKTHDIKQEARHITMNSTLDNLKAKETDPFASFEDKGPDCQYGRYVTHHNSFGVNEWIGKTRIEARFTLPPDWKIAEFMDELIAEKEVEGSVAAGLFCDKTKSTRSKPTPSIVLCPPDNNRGLVTTFLKCGFWGCQDHSHEPTQKELAKLDPIIKQVVSQASKLFFGMDLNPSSIVGSVSSFALGRFSHYFGGSFMIDCPNGTKGACTCWGQNEKTYRFFLTVCSRNESEISWTQDFMNQIVRNLRLGYSPPTQEERMVEMGNLINEFRASKGLKKLPF